MADGTDKIDIDNPEERRWFVEYWTNHLLEMISRGRKVFPIEFIGLEGGILGDLMRQYIDTDGYRLWTDRNYHMSDNKLREVRSIERLQIDVDRHTWSRVVDALAQAGVNAMHEYYKGLAYGKGEAGDYHLARIGGVGYYPRVLHDAVFAADQEGTATDYSGCMAKIHEMEYIIVQRQEDGTFIDLHGQDIYSP